METETTTERRFPDAMLEEAARHPNTTMFEVAEGWDRNGEVPIGAVRGAWPIDDAGRPTGQFIENPKFDPTLAPPARCPFHH
jgi:hypothetical protein